MNDEMYTYEMPPIEDLYLNLNFRKDQLDALKLIYEKHFKKYIEGFQYVGNGISLFWYKNSDANGKNYVDPYNSHGFNVTEAVNDPLWDAFSDILPYMGQTGTITYLPPFSVMTPHIDRTTRPTPIYFPISGCNPDCFSDWYHLPKYKDPSKYHSTIKPALPKYTHAIVDKACLLKTSEWHGVRNHSRTTRITFGWNSKGDKDQKTFEELRKIFKDLGY